MLDIDRILQLASDLDPGGAELTADQADAIVTILDTPPARKRLSSSQTVRSSRTWDER